MRSDWESTTIGSLCTITRGASPRPIHNYYADDGVPWIKISDATSSNSRFIESTSTFIKESGRSKSVEVFPGDLIVSNSATPALPRIVGLNACIHDGWLLLRDFQDFDKLYACYLIDHIRPSLLRLGNGSVFTNLKTQILKDFEVPLPPLAEQKRIAALLGSLDDLIELNREMNQILEEMAQAIFKSWFIDFDGVPEEDLVESELGLIPRGWEVKTINDVVKIVGGSTPSTKVNAYWEGGEIYWTTPKDLSSLSVPVLSDTARKITSQGLEKISSGLLPEGTLLMSSRAPVGYLAINTMPVAINQGYIAMLSGGEVSPLWLLYWSHANMDHIKSRAGGSTFAEISKRNFRTINVLKPSQALLDEFETQVSGLRSIVVNNTQQSQILSELRDTLLPKLISGELRIPEAEKMVEDVL